MRMFWTLQIGVAAAAVAGFTALGVACSSTTTSTDTSTDTLTATETATSTETATETATATDTGTGTATDDTCACACTDLMSAGGCADLCSTLKNGATSPNFCEGMAPLTMCGTCLAAHCSALGAAAGTCTGM